MYWWMHTRCNFNCEYCFREFGDKNSQPENLGSGKNASGDIVRRLDETGKLWHIYMTGGEPFLYPDFTGIARGLTRHHYISFSTNLSTNNVDIFADTVDSGRVVSLDVSLHIQEREKIPNGLSDLIKKLRYLQCRNFKTRLLYVAYPPLLSRMKEDFKHLKAEGVSTIEAKIFQGTFQGRRYPRSYSENERALMQDIGMNHYEQEILASRISFLGKKCAAGHLAFVIDPSGKITRCNSLKNEYGNLFEGTFKPDKRSRRCTVRKCTCAYQGMKFADGRASQVPPNIIARPVRFFLSAWEKTVNNHLLKRQ